jgi:hypothetical protein
MEESEMHVPLYYVLGRDISDVDAVSSALQLTPCAAGIATSEEDKALLQPLVDEVYHAADGSAVREWAVHLARAVGIPILIVEDGSALTAVFPDGKEEAVCLSKPTSMN